MTPTSLDPAIATRELRVALDRIGDITEEAYGEPVTGCPGWSVGDVIAHVVRVHEWVRAALAASSTDPVRFPNHPGVSGSALREVYRLGADELVAALIGAEPGREVFTFAGPRPSVWWLRRQLHEAAIHAWDVQRAAGDPDPVATVIAADAIDEYVEVFLTRLDLAAFGASGQRMNLQSSSGPDRWRFRFDLGGVIVDHCMGAIDDAADGGADDVIATAPSSDLVLFIWSRLSPAQLVTRGDNSLLERFQAASSI